jgi:hypothetical protein
LEGDALLVTSADREVSEPAANRILGLHKLEMQSLAVVGPRVDVPCIYSLLIILEVA